ncbi:MAG: hypothetical protein ABW131_02655, partial [Candidatus Sedimenticola sp. 6PFRAG5]
MSQQQNRIECPNCGHEIDVNEILYHQLDEELKKKYNDELAKEKLRLSDREDQIKSQQQALADQRSALEEQVSEGIAAGLKGEKAKLESRIKAQAEEEQAERIKALQSELADKTDKVKELNKSKSEIERLKREKEELRGAIELETQQKLNAQLNEEREKIRKAEENRATLKL